MWFHDKGKNELADKYWQRAQQLNPEDWNYHRQQWSFGTTQDAGKKWMDKFQKLEEPYYPELKIEPKKQNHLATDGHR